MRSIVSTPRLVLGVVFMLLSSLLSTGVLSAKTVPNTELTCADVLMVFNRGSGENTNSNYLDLPFGDFFREKEKITGAFFKSFQTKVEQDYPLVTYKAVSVHNFPNLYNNNGYRAVGAFSATTFLNAVQAEFSWFPFGDYNDSVGDGKEETVGYIKDQINLCPEQQLVLGGYSQGAQVMGESVFQLSGDERQKIAALALFGDPKYVGSDISHTSSMLNWFDAALSIFDRPEEKPWKRGTAGLNDRGLADARIPYVPSDMDYKTLSWCFGDDFVCSGGSGIFQTVVNSVSGGTFFPSADDYAIGHSRYATFGAPQAASEIVQRLSPTLNQINKERGGKNPEGLASQPPPSSPNDKPIDVMMMLNTSAGVDDVLGQMRLNTLEVLPPMHYFFSDVLFGIGEYNEVGSLPNARIPRVAIHQNLTANITNLNTKMYRPLSSGLLSAGGLDAPDPHQIGVERAIMSTTWRPDSEKHLVLITHRMPIGPYTYNICNSDVRIGFGITTPNKCGTDPSQETDLSRLHPERCSKIYDVLTLESCKLDMTNPYHTYNVTRSIDDAINLARAKGISIDVVVPHPVVPFFDSVAGIQYDSTTISNSLKRIADSTGGIYLPYDSFTRANYTDMYWRVLNHKPKISQLALINNYNELGSADRLMAFEPEQVKTNEPIFFDAGGDLSAPEYKWDFDGDGTWDEETIAPNTDYVYESDIGQSFSAVAGFDGGVEKFRALVPIEVSAGEESEVLISPQLLENLKAVRKGNDIEVSWTAGSSEGVLFIGDLGGGLPIISAPFSYGSIILQDAERVLSTLIVWVDDGVSSSNRIEIPVEEESTKILNETESNPNSQFIGPQTLAPISETTSTPSTLPAENILPDDSVTEVKGEQDAQPTKQAKSVVTEEFTGDFEQEPTSNNDNSKYIVVAVVLGGITAIFGFSWLLMKKR